jgi:hypothetical protein
MTLRHVILSAVGAAVANPTHGTTSFETILARAEGKLGHPMDHDEVNEILAGLILDGLADRDFNSVDYYEQWDKDKPQQGPLRPLHRSRGMIQFNYERSSDGQPRAHIKIMHSFGIDALELAGLIVAYNAGLGDWDGGEYTEDARDEAAEKMLDAARTLTRAQIESELRTQFSLNGEGEWSQVDGLEEDFEAQLTEIVNARVRSFWPEGVHQS